MFAHLLGDFGSLQAFVLRTDAASAAPGLPNLCWCRNVGSRGSKRCADAAFGARMFSGPISRFRWPTRKAFVLATDAAFATPGLPNLCWCRNVGFKASNRCAGAAFRARDVCVPFLRFRWPTKEAFVLWTDDAFAAPGLPNLCWCRNARSRANTLCCCSIWCSDVFRTFSHISVAY